MITVEQARAIAKDYAERTRSYSFESELEDRDGYWIARVGFIGSLGVVIDKADGRLTVLGSAYPLDDWLWGYERGLLEGDGTVRVLAVHDEEKTVALLGGVALGGPPAGRNPWPRRAWVRECLCELPADFRWAGSLGLSIPSFQAAVAEGWFDAEILFGTRLGRGLASGRQRCTR